MWLDDGKLMGDSPGLYVYVLCSCILFHTVGTAMGLQAARQTAHTPLQKARPQRTKLEMLRNVRTTIAHTCVQYMSKRISLHCRAVRGLSLCTQSQKYTTSTVHTDALSHSCLTPLNSAPRHTVTHVSER